MAAKKKRILCIEDHDTYAETIKEYLELRLNVEVDIALHGVEAVEHLAEAFLSETAYDLIVLDMMLPRVKAGPVEMEFGVEMLTELRRRYGILPDATSVVVYTAYNQKNNSWSDTIKTCVASVKQGASDFILKANPETEKDNMDSLVEACDRILRDELQAGDDIAQWFAQYRDAIIEQFGGRVVALIDVELAREQGITGKGVGDYIIIDGDSYGEVRRKVLRKPVIALSMPQIINIPRIEDLEL